MTATVFDIIDRSSQASARRAALSNFQLREHGQASAREILEHSHMSLYSLDFEMREACFVETSADVDLSQASFYFATQLERAERVWTISFETLLQLAQSVALNDRRLVHIYSVGRCGSTLASQLFAQVPGVVNISESAVLSQLVVARNTKLVPDNELMDLLEATVCLLCKTPAETVWVLKGQSFVIELADWLHKLYPQTKNLFLYRQAETWLLSGLRAFGGDPATTEEAIKQRDKQGRERLGPLVPLIASFDPDRPLPHAGTLSLMWLRAMERYLELNRNGMAMLAIRYESWRSAPRETAAAMLEHCGCKPADMTAIYETLAKDSQADTYLSRDTLGQSKRVLTEDELAELNWHLDRHPFVHEADFEVPNTFKLK